MKNRKIVVVAFLLIAVLLMSIGYAAFTDTLTIIGNAIIDIKKAEDNWDEKIYFSAGEFTKHGSGDNTKDVVGGIGTDDATFAIHSLATKDETATVVFTIFNDSNVPVLIEIPDKKLSGDNNQSNTNADYFDIEYKYSRADMTIPAGETMTVTITVKVSKPITEETGATFGIEFKATTLG